MIRKSLILQIGRKDVIDTPVKDTVVYFSYFDSPEQLYFVNDKAKIKEVKFNSLESIIPSTTKKEKPVILPRIKPTLNVLSAEAISMQKRIHREDVKKTQNEIFQNKLLKEELSILKKELLLLKIHNKTRELEIQRTKKDLKEIKENLNPVKDKKESKLRKFFTFKK